MADLFLTNSLTRKKEKFEPINPPKVGMYTCGFTVYDYAHIGSGRKYTYDDILRRVLQFNGYDVVHVQNVTDVGHLVSDDDEGEDKLEKGARKFGKDPWEVANFFTDDFYVSMDKLNILRPNIICRATENIPEQIELIKKLIEKGVAYDTPEAVYFDISKFPNYGNMFGQRLADKKKLSREDLIEGEHKNNPFDFVLWVKRVGVHENHIMHWNSPWGDGFPGWHIECSAMSMKYLGEQFDIHTGGEDHIPIHHPNEVAQSEAATERSPFVRYWVHYAFLQVDGKKMSKSLGNMFTIHDVEEKGYDPMSLRYLYLTSHYKDPLNFTWKSLSGSQSALKNLRKQVYAAKTQTDRTALSVEKDKKREEYSKLFLEALNDDLNTAKALAVLWEVMKSNIPSEDKYDFALLADEVLGLNLGSYIPENIEVPKEVEKLLDERNRLRSEGQYEEADNVRNKIAEAGFLIEDTKDGARLVQK